MKPNLKANQRCLVNDVPATNKPFVSTLNYLVARKEEKSPPNFMRIRRENLVAGALGHLPVTAIASEPQPELKISVRVIYAIDDLSNPGIQPQPSPSYTLEDVKTKVDTLIKAANRDMVGTGIRFSCNLDTDVEIRPDTKLRRDYFMTDSVRDTIERGLGEADPNELISIAWNEAVEHRNEVANEKPDTLLWIFSRGNTFEKQAAQPIGSKWVHIDTAPGSFSGSDLGFVRLHESIISSLTVAQDDASRVVHENGHYLGLSHTHREWPKAFHNINQIAPQTDPSTLTPLDRLNIWTQAVSDWLDKELPPVRTVALAEREYDADFYTGVEDTPADPGAGILALANDAAGFGNNELGPITNVMVSVPGIIGNIQFTPLRDNPMGYYLTETPDAMKFTPDQITRMRDLLTNGPRRNLVATQLGDTAYPRLRFGALWNEGVQDCVWWPMCTEQQLRQQISEHWGTMRIKEMHAFVLDEQVWYSALWETGQYKQAWWPNCSEAELRAKTEELWGNMRIAQMQAFVVGDQVRYSCLWNQGTHSQTWWPNCSETELRAKTAEVWNNRRFAQIQAFVLDGQVRYSCIWNEGTFAQVWFPNCSDAEFREKTGELWSSMRPAQLQPFAAGGQMRFSALWNPGTNMQVWYPSCTEEQVRLSTVDMWDTMRPASWYPVVMG